VETVSLQASVSPSCSPGSLETQARCAAVGCPVHKVEAPNFCQILACMPAAAPVNERPVAFPSAAAAGLQNEHERACVVGLDGVAASIEAASRARASAVFPDAGDDCNAGTDLGGRWDCTSRDSACMHIHHFAAQKAAEAWHAAEGLNCYDGYGFLRWDASAIVGFRVAPGEGRWVSGEMRKARG
jgi:hypothetical protein